MTTMESSDGRMGQSNPDLSGGEIIPEGETVPEGEMIPEGETVPEGETGGEMIPME